MANNLEDEMYAVFEQRQDAVMARVFALDREIHEHGPDCEMRCPKQRSRELLLDLANDIAVPFEKFFQPQAEVPQ